jgi:hypothetical protein
MTSSPCLVHKKILGIGPGLRIMLDANFLDLWLGVIRNSTLQGFEAIGCILR